MDIEVVKKSLTDNSSKSKYSLLFKSKQEQEGWFTLVKTKTQLQPLLKEVETEAERLIEKPIDEITYSIFKLFSADGSRLKYEKVYFEKRRRLTTFALATLLFPVNKAYQSELEEIIWSICNEYTWCLPAHLMNSPEMETDSTYTLEMKPDSYSIDLFAAETAFALSEILQLTEEIIDPLINKRIRQEIYQRIIWPFVHQNGFHWERATHNWAAVCAGSIGSVALHLIDNDEELSVILERVLETMEYYLKGFNDDGTCMEGYGYWEYGFGFYVYFADLLKKRTSGKIDLFNQDKVHQIALFQQKTFLDNNRVVNFSDAVPTASVFLGLSHYLASIYPDFNIPERKLAAAFTDDHCSRWAPALRNLLWFDELAVGRPWEIATYYLQDSQWFISRHVSKNGRYAFAAKGGHNDEPHNHNDIGHFILYGNEETFLKDLGSGEYTRPYFGEERYSFLCNGSHGHSVPIINNQYQVAGRTKSASVCDISTGTKVETFEIEFSRGYSVDSLQQLLRRFTWRKLDKPCLILEDVYTFSKCPESIIERLITPVRSFKEGKDGIIIGDKQLLNIKFDRNLLDLQIHKVDFSNHAGEKEENLAIDLHVKNPQKECTVKVTFQF